jgi:hypothetical protein
MHPAKLPSRWLTKLPMRARPSALRRHLGRARERLGDRLLTWLTVLLIFLTFVIVPLHASGLIVWEGYGLGIALVMAACVLGSSAGLWSVGVILAGVGLAIARSAVRFMSQPWYAVYLDAAA